MGSRKGVGTGTLPSSPLAEYSSKQSTYLSYINHKSVSHISDEAIHVDPKVTERQEQSTALATHVLKNKVKSSFFFCILSVPGTHFNTYLSFTF